MSVKYHVTISWSDNGRGRSSRIYCEDLEDAKLVSDCILGTDYKLPIKLPYKLQEIIIFDNKGNEVECPLACRG